MKFRELAYPLELLKKIRSYHWSVFQNARDWQTGGRCTTLSWNPPCSCARERARTHWSWQESIVKDSQNNNPIRYLVQHSHMQTAKTMQMRTLRCIRDFVEPARNPVAIVTWCISFHLLAVSVQECQWGIWWCLAFLWFRQCRTFGRQRFATLQIFVESKNPSENLAKTHHVTALSLQVALFCVKKAQG